MIYDMTNVPDSEEDLKEARENAKNRFRLWRNRSIYSIVALLLSCTSVYPFVNGRELSVHGEAVKQVFLLLSLGMLIVTLYCTLLLWGAWRLFRQLESSPTR
jgi:hypothetical protein